MFLARNSTMAVQRAAGWMTWMCRKSAFFDKILFRMISNVALICSRCLWAREWTWLRSERNQSSIGHLSRGSPFFFLCEHIIEGKYCWGITPFINYKNQTNAKRMLDTRKIGVPWVLAGREANEIAELWQILKSALSIWYNSIVSWTWCSSKHGRRARTFAPNARYTLHTS